MLENDGLTQSMSRVGHCIDNGPIESFQGFIKDMAKVLFAYEEAAEIIYRTYEYYIYRYPQKRFKTGSTDCGYTRTVSNCTKQKNRTILGRD